MPCEGRVLLWINSGFLSVEVVPEQLSIETDKEDVDSCFKIRGTEMTQRIAIDTDFPNEGSSRESIMITAIERFLAYCALYFSKSN